MAIQSLGSDVVLAAPGADCAARRPQGQVIFWASGLKDTSQQAFRVGR